MLKHVPHLLEEKADVQNDGNTDDKMMCNTFSTMYTVHKTQKVQKKPLFQTRAIETWK